MSFDKAVSGADVSMSSAESSPQTIIDAVVSKLFSSFEMRFAKLDSKIEALTFSAIQKIEVPVSPEPEIGLTNGGGAAANVNGASPDFNTRSRSDHRPNRQSLGSFRSDESQDVVVRNVKSSFRLDKPKFEFPSDIKNDGAFDDSVLKFIEECNRHIEMWLNLPENMNKEFEGSEVFALVSLPAAVQKRVAHNLDMIFEKSEVIGWSLAEIQQAKMWNKATTNEVKQCILVRKAQGIAMKDAVKTIQSPAISWPAGTGLIHLDAFEEYKSKMTTQVSRLSEGGVSLSFIAIKDAIISAIPDRDFKVEMYTQFGHSGSLSGPNASGVIQDFSMKSIFDFIRTHIVVIKKKGLAQIVNKNSVAFAQTPPTVRKYGTSQRAVQNLDFKSADFPETDRQFWEPTERPQVFSDDDEYTSVNTAVQMATSKNCKHVGIGPDGKLICPWLGKPDTAKCGFRHPPNELALKGKGVSISKKVHQVVGLGIPYADEGDDSETREEL
jgi:hypothetical protein